MGFSDKAKSSPSLKKSVQPKQSIDQGKKSTETISYKTETATKLSNLGPQIELDALKQTLTPSSSSSSSTGTGSHTSTTHTSTQTTKILSPDPHQALPGKSQSSLNQILSSPSGDIHATSIHQADETIRQAFFYQAFINAGLTTTDFAMMNDILDSDREELSAYRGGAIRISSIAQIIKYARYKRQKAAESSEQGDNPSTLEEWKRAMIEECAQGMDRAIDRESAKDATDRLTTNGAKLQFFLKNYAFLSDEQKETLHDCVQKILQALTSGLYIEIYEIHTNDDGTITISRGDQTTTFSLGPIITNTSSPSAQLCKQQWNMIHGM